jgi:outer membrane protein OmpA-like peptidoglycan-associated protein
MIRRGLLIALAVAGPVFAQEVVKTTNLQTKVVDLEFRVTDLAGNPVNELATKVQDLEVKEIGNEVHIELNADVLFDFDKADILPKAVETLSKAAAIVKEQVKDCADDATPTRKATTHTTCGRPRSGASSVRDWLRTKGGLASFQFDAKGFGETQPVAPNTKPDGSDDPEDGRGIGVSRSS